VHGAFLAGLISKVLGMDFPGERTVYISQNSSFKRPVFVDSTVRVEVKVTQVNAEKRRLVLDTTILNSDGKACLAGSAEVWLPE
jgi:3-hydroxybutyryl-CoA dehydratase